MTAEFYEERRCDRGLVFPGANLRCQRAYEHPGVHRHEGIAGEQSGYHENMGNGFLEGNRFVAEWGDVSWRQNGTLLP